ncbi:hypothetical protein [Actinomyces faecalis]|uniref:hypothetical protein n=1 Tax=Actinomyces faecalis TaxID=2722820 RepID=UPI00155732B3|nr:hypothetical protein [Actinomyces faecalis]
MPLAVYFLVALAGMALCLGAGAAISGVPVIGIAKTYWPIGLIFLAYLTWKIYRH